MWVDVHIHVISKTMENRFLKSDKPLHIIQFSFIWFPDERWNINKSEITNGTTDLYIVLLPFWHRKWEKKLNRLSNIIVWHKKMFHLYKVGYSWSFTMRNVSLIAVLSKNMFETSLEPSRQDGSKEGSQRVFIWRNMEIIPKLFLAPLLIWRTAFKENGQ